MTTLYVILFSLGILFTVIMTVYWSRRGLNYIRVNAEKGNENPTRQYELYIQIRDSLNNRNDWVVNDQTYRCYFNFTTGIELKIQEHSDEISIVSPTIYKFNKSYSRDLKRRFKKISSHVVGYTDKRREDLLKQFLAGNLKYHLKIEHIHEIHYNNELRTWIEEACEGEVFYNGNLVIYFTDQGDAVAFKLKYPELVTG